MQMCSKTRQILKINRNLFIFSNSDDTARIYIFAFIQSSCETKHSNFRGGYCNNGINFMLLF